MNAGQMVAFFWGIDTSQSDATACSAVLQIRCLATGGLHPDAG
ncbi:hypothetical protein [Escherichia coli]|nr:hypothetical protein [Escherichia coli]